MIQWYLKVVKDNYANFNGRARRSEYWYFALANFIICLLLSIIDMIIFGEDGINRLSGLYSILVIIPSIAVSIRRMHDINKSGWWILINLIPFIGWIWFIVLACTEGDKASNQYGSDPKAEIA